MMKLSTRELAWAAGLFEGEGCITINPFKTMPTRSPVPVLILSMTDEDSVRRFHRAVGGLGSIRVLRQADDSRYASGLRQRQWTWQTSCHQRVQAVIAMLWFGLGERRRSRAIEVLKETR